MEYLARQRPGAALDFPPLTFFLMVRSWKSRAAVNVDYGSRGEVVLEEKKNGLGNLSSCSGAGNGMSSCGLSEKFFSLLPLLREEWGIDEAWGHGIDSSG